MFVCERNSIRLYSSESLSRQTSSSLFSKSCRFAERLGILHLRQIFKFVHENPIRYTRGISRPRLTTYLSQLCCRVFNRNCSLNARAGYDLWGAIREQLVKPRQGNRLIHRGKCFATEIFLQLNFKDAKRISLV